MTAPWARTGPMGWTFLLRGALLWLDLLIFEVFFHI
jgi:hypothetical protein